MTAPSEEQRRRPVTRRSVVAAAGGAGLTVALTACGSDDDGGSSGTGSTGDGGTTGGTSGGSAAGGSTGGSGGGQAVAKVADIPEGGGKVVGDVVITQPSAGQFKAFSSKCPHQGCAVRGVENNVITCPCHNSTFDASDGSVKAGPANSPLPAKSVKVEGDSIILA
ncbi:Rieske (2Fe-2S) protein [Streptomyces sp. NPDC048057]|uniref:Rieske (2Fe-2S) protein n=1 Tax=Streptomyces sp. NPDC048057 TaxID=3155628 RepID=UPI0033CE7DB1